MRVKDLAALGVALIGMLTLGSLMLVQTLQEGRPQGELIIALTAIVSSAAHWVFRNGNGHIGKSSGGF